MQRKQACYIELIVALNGKFIISGNFTKTIRIEQL